MHRRRVACIDGRGEGVLIEEELGAPAAGRVEVEVRASLISPGTELGRVPDMRRHPRPEQPARPFGYANAGVVRGLGEGVEGYRAGDRIACMGGGYAHHADRCHVPVHLTVPIPQGVSFEAAAFAHLAATALHAIRRAAPVFGENGLVVGLGLVGQLTVQFGRLSGCHMMGVDRFDLRRRLARKLGLEAVAGEEEEEEEDPVGLAADFTGGYGMDFGVIAFGGDATGAFEQIAATLKRAPDTHRMGRIVVVGGARISHGFAAALGNVDVRSAARTGPGYHDEAYEHGAAYPPVFVEWPTRRNLAECLRAVADARLRVEPLITHRFGLDQIGAAVDELVERPEGALGVVLRP